MIARNVFQLVLKVLIYLLSYFLITSHLNIFNTAICMSYTGAILLLPIDSNPVRVMLFAFLVGLGVDIFHSSLGIHTAACVMLGFFRANFLNWMVPAGGYEEYMTISIPALGFRWFFPFAFGLLFIHHFVYFLIDFASLDHFLDALIATFSSTIFTFLFLVLIQYGIEPPSRGN